MKRIFVFLTFFLFALPGFTQNYNQNLAPAADSSDATISTSLPSMPSIFSDPLPEGGLKSYNDSGRVRDLNSPSGKQMRSRNEYFIGVKSKAGWGVIAQAVENGSWYGDGSKNMMAPGDPSFSIQHPVYENQRLSISGMFREYFPASNFSVTNHVWQQAYYSFLLYKMPHEWDLANILIPRYFSAPKYVEIPGKNPDATFATEDFFSVTRKAARWFRYGVGVRTYVECHSIAPVGKTMDVYPLADFMLSNKVYLGPRLYFPIAAQNSVFDGDTGVNTDNIYAEIYLQATL